jgi:Lactate racemase N-terminal domain
VPRVPLLASSRIVVVNAPEGSALIAPPPPVEPIADVGAAVADALQFPLAGEPLPQLATRGGRATIVVEPPSLPLPGTLRDPRQTAIAATVAEVERAGIPDERQTLLVAGGLARRAGRTELELLVSPEFARRFRGRVVVHDAESPELVHLGDEGRVPLRVNPALVETDLIVTVTAAETVLHGGPAALLAAAGSEAVRGAETYSLLETAASQGWRLAVAVERALAARVATTGVSLALNNPEAAGALHGYPHDPEAVDRLLRLPGPRLFSALPGAIRHRILQRVPRHLTATAAFAGPPSVAHAEALLRAVESRSAELAGPLDTIVLGIPRVTYHLPREAPNPLLAAGLGLGLALRLWRDSAPVADGGTVILVHPFRRRFAHPTQAPYRAFFGALRTGIREPDELADAERAAATDPRAIASYRDGRSCHPVLPFLDWSGCAPVLARVGTVLIAGCRDATAARLLGFVPTHGIGAAFAMARGRAPAGSRMGFLLSPPYFPLRVGHATRPGQTTRDASRMQAQTPTRSNGPGERS